MSNYIDLALKTKSDQFHNHMVDHFHLFDMLKHFVAVGEELDKMKKGLFYGKRYENQNNAANPVLLGVIHPDLLHGLLGKITETAELAQCLLTALEGGDLDLINLAEEIGDSQWYDAIMADCLNTTFEALQQMNIAKLAKRFPEKFTSELAINRNVEEERKILENN